MTGKISKCSSVSERKSCVYCAVREAVWSVRNEGRLTSQGANSSGERGKVTYVVMIAEGRAVGDRSRVTVGSLCSVVRQKCDRVSVISGGFVYLLWRGWCFRISEWRATGLCTVFNISVIFIYFIVWLLVVQIHVFKFDFSVHGAMFILGAFWKRRASIRPLASSCPSACIQKSASRLPEVLRTANIPEVLRATDIPEVLRAANIQAVLRAADIPKVLRAADIREVLRMAYVREIVQLKKYSSFKLFGTWSTKWHTWHYFQTLPYIYIK